MGRLTLEDRIAIRRSRQTFFSISDNQSKMKGLLYTKKFNDKQDEERNMYFAVYCPLFTVVFFNFTTFSVKYF